MHMCWIDGVLEATEVHLQKLCNTVKRNSLMSFYSKSSRIDCDMTAQQYHQSYSDIVKHEIKWFMMEVKSSENRCLVNYSTMTWK